MFFGEIGGFLNKDKSEERLNKTVNLNQDTSGTRTGSEAETARTTGAQLTTGRQDVTTLDEGTQAVLAGLIEKMAGGADAFSARAAGADEALAGDIDAILASARQSATGQLQAATTRNMARAGSGFNTLVQAQQARDMIDLETALGGLAGELGMAGRQQVTEEMLSGLAAPAQAISPLAQVLKGATTRGVTQEAAEQQSDTQRMLTQLEAFLEELRSVEKTKATSVTTGKQWGAEGKLGFDMTGGGGAVD